MRYALAICLFGIIPVISGCAGGYYVDPADVRARQLASAGRVSGPERTAVRVVSRSRAQPGSSASQNDIDVTGATGRSDEAKPWPKRGTPEANRLQAEEAARDRRIGEMLRNGICRGC